MRSLNQISFFILPLIVITGCGGNHEKASTPTSLKVTVKQLTATGLPEAFSYSGTIEADNSVSLGFSVSGRVTAVNVQEGEHVTQGQLLATIETLEYQNSLLLAQASLEQAEDNFKRLQELYSKGSLPERDYISAKVAVSQARVNNSTAAKRLSDTKLYAPFAGIIAAKSIEKGATAAPGVMAFTIVKTDLVYAQVSVSESEISKLSVGTDAEISVPVLHETIKGKISIINPQADATTRSFKVKVRIANTNGKLLPGMLADIKITTNRTLDAITIPVSTVIRDADDITYVYTVKSQRAIKKRVTVSGLLMNEIIVTEGLHAGDTIITQGQNKLKDGQLVSL